MSYPLRNEPDLSIASGLHVAEERLDVTLQVESGPWSGKHFRVPAGQHSFKIGRSFQSDVAFANDAYISRVHFSLDWDGTAWWIKDLNSRHGTFVNEKKVEIAPLHDGDTIRVGYTVMAVRLLAHDPAVPVICDNEDAATRVSAAPEPATLEAARPDLTVRMLRREEI